MQTGAGRRLRKAYGESSFPEPALKQQMRSHLHILVTDGGFALNGTFYVLPKVSLSGLEQLFRHRVLKMMLRSGLVTHQ